MACNRILAGTAVAAIGTVALATEPGSSAANTDIDAELNCLAENVYHEARGESEAGQLAVAGVTLQRVADSRWPSTICEVVWQPYQFSWTHDQLSDEMVNTAARNTAYRLAKAAIHMESHFPATHYHANYVHPSWADKLKLVATIGNHHFYK